MSNSSIHPLKAAFNDFVRSHYGITVFGDKNTHKTEIIAAKVLKFGLDYSEFVEIVCTLWQDYATKQGMKYPVWNLVTSDKSFERIGELLQVMEPAIQDNTAVMFEYELLFAQQYIEWLAGQAPQPSRQLHPPLEIKIKAAQKICQQNQIPFLSSNYNNIYRQLYHG